MRIDHVVDPAQGRATVHHRVLPPPAAPPPRRVQGINKSGEDPSSDTAPADDAISLALSPEAREAARQAALDELRERAAGRRDDARNAGEPEKGLTEEQRKEVERLEELDRQVRQRQQARAATSGALASSGVVYRYQMGPDGRLYAVDGGLDIDLSPVPGDPEATLKKAEEIQRTVVGPGDAMPDDRSAAAAAAALAARARQELARQKQAEEVSQQQAAAHSAPLDTVA